MSDSVRVKAKIRCVIEVDVGVWKSDTSFDAIREQVRKEGTNIVNGIFSGGNRLEPPNGRLVSVPTVLVVSLEE